MAYFPAEEGDLGKAPRTMWELKGGQTLVPESLKIHFKD